MQQASKIVENFPPRISNYYAERQHAVGQKKKFTMSFSNPSVTEAGSGVVFEQRDRLEATINFIYAGIYNLRAKTKKG